MKLYIMLPIQCPRKMIKKTWLPFMQMMPQKSDNADAETWKTDPNINVNTAFKDHETMSYTEETNTGSPLGYFKMLFWQFDDYFYCYTCSFCLNPSCLSGDLFFFKNIKRGVYYFEVFKGWLYFKRKLIFKDDNLRRDLSYFFNKNSEVLFFKRTKISSTFPVLLHQLFCMKND